MFMVCIELDADKEPSCLWKPLRGLGEKCREEMPSAGIIALHKGTLSCFKPVHFYINLMQAATAAKEEIPSAVFG